MHRKLSFYMLTIVLVIVAFIGVGLFFVGQFSTTENTRTISLSRINFTQNRSKNTSTILR